ncbi:MAG: fructose-bisphosphatase class II family protein [Gemmataceae bacterium]
MRHMLFDLIRSTEAAAIAASHFIGSGDKLAADKAATTAMRDKLNETDFCARVVIGEGKKDESDGLFCGEVVGKHRGKCEPAFDLAIDPIDGTRPTVNSGPEAVSVLALANVGSMWSTEEFYMNKLAFGPALVRAGMSLAMSIPEIVTATSRELGKPLNQIMVCMLDRPRHAKYISQLRKMGVRIKLIQDCDISGAIATCLEASGVDLLYGAGGAPESVITACAIRSLGGGFKAQIVDAECNPKGPVMDQTEMVTGPCAFAATGITNGSLLQGVRFASKGPVTNSVFMRSESGTVRWLSTHHGN